MAIQTIGLGTSPNDGTGDPARTCFSKINSNFTDTENAASKLVATEAQAIAGEAGVLPDAAGVKAHVDSRMVGTVSQSGGVPTGAIIERGSNSNGEYVKFADGTMIQWGTVVYTGAITTATGAIFQASDLTTASYPINFNDATKAKTMVFVRYVSGDVRAWVTGQVQGESSFGCLLHSATSSASTDFRIDYQAIGTWY